MPPSGYVMAERLDPAGQRFQGDVFAAAPFLCARAEGGGEVETHPAVLLTPTCDFALKAGGDVRQVCAIEVLTLESPLRQQFAQNIIPQHVVPLPPLESLLPAGGAVQLRRSSPIHADRLEALSRVTTLNEGGLRSLLTGHTRYYLRTVIDGTQIKIPPDDPRLLWSALDAASAERKFAAKRDAVLRALEVAITTIAQHHGIASPNTAMSLYRLHAIAQRAASSPAACAAIRMLIATEQALKGIYQTPPRDPASLQPALERLLIDLEMVGWVLQARNAVQFNEQQYRALVQGQAPTAPRIPPPD